MKGSKMKILALCLMLPICMAQTVKDPKPGETMSAAAVANEPKAVEIVNLHKGQMNNIDNLNAQMNPEHVVVPPKDVAQVKQNKNMKKGRRQNRRPFRGLNKLARRGRNKGRFNRGGKSLVPVDTHAVETIPTEIHDMIDRILASHKDVGSSMANQRIKEQLVDLITKERQRMKKIFEDKCAQGRPGNRPRKFQRQPRLLKFRNRKQGKNNKGQGIRKAIRNLTKGGEKPLKPGLKKQIKAAKREGNAQIKRDMVFTPGKQNKQWRNNKDKANEKRGINWRKLAKSNRRNRNRNKGAKKEVQPPVEVAAKTLPATADTKPVEIKPNVV